MIKISFKKRVLWPKRTRKPGNWQRLGSKQMKIKEPEVVEIPSLSHQGRHLTRVDEGVVTRQVKHSAHGSHSPRGLKEIQTGGGERGHTEVRVMTSSLSCCRCGNPPHKVQNQNRECGWDYQGKISWLETKTSRTGGGREKRRFGNREVRGIQKARRRGLLGQEIHRAKEYGIAWAGNGQRIQRGGVRTFSER